MVRRRTVAVILGGFVLLTAVPATRAAEPIAMTQRVVSSPDKRVVAPTGVFEQPTPLMAVSVACDETPPETELSRRLREKGAGKAGFYGGLVVGTAVGSAMFGPVGGVFCGSVCAFIGEVVGEFLGSQLFRPSPLPRMMPPLRP